MKPISRKSSTAASGCFVRVFGLVFFLVGLSVFIGFTGLPMARWIGAQTWSATPCTIVSSEVGTHSSSDGTTYSIDIRYAYTWEGQPHEGTRYNFFGGSSSGYDRKEAVVLRYPAGSQAECYVNPSNPDEAVLDRSFSFTYLIGSFGLIFLLFGAAMLFHRGAKSSGPSADSLSGGGEVRPISHRSLGLPVEAAHTLDSGFQMGEAVSHGPVALKGGYNSIGGFVFLLIFALIWNGIVFAAAWDNFSGGWSGIDLFGALFLLPFILIGLATIGGAAYFFLTLFNPRVDITMDPGQLNLGGTATVAWTFRGSASRLSRLSIHLVGQEAATYRRGTSTTTDRSVFEKILLFETEEPGSIQQGEATVSMPEFTAPSFEAPNNKIQWKIKVHGTIDRWPDVNEEFDVTVLPLPVDTAGLPRAEFQPNGAFE